MKQLLFTFLLLSSTYLLVGQDKENINLLITEDSWRKESFRFPIPFAKTVDFNGVADVRFTQGWEDVNSPNFWSYAFGWSIILEEKLSETEIEKYMQLYFDGLMNVINKDKSKVIPPTIAVFTSINSKEDIIYKGKIQIYDAFFTQEIITLNVQGHYSYCSSEDKSIYVFKLSPKQLDSPVWKHINKVVLRDDICESN